MSKYLQTTISKNLKILRNHLGMTQDIFAARIGIKRSLLGAYEEARAEPNLKTLEKISKTFGVTLDSLIMSTDGIEIRNGSYLEWEKEEKKRRQELNKKLELMEHLISDIKRRNIY